LVLGSPDRGILPKISVFNKGGIRDKEYGTLVYMEQMNEFGYIPSPEAEDKQLVIYGLEWLIKSKTDPVLVNRLRRLDEKDARIRSGESNIEQEYGLSAEVIRAKLDRRTPDGRQGPMRYRLPKGLHYMGDRSHQIIIGTIPEWPIKSE
jgi:hypothetical protein